MTKPSAVETVGTRLQMPFLLMCGMGLAMFYGSVAIVVFIVLAAVAPFGGGSYSLNGHVVSRAEFLAGAWPLLIGWPIASAIIVAIAYALWKELPWSRAAIVAYLLVITALAAVLLIWKGGGEDVLPSIATLAIVTAGIGWYLYGKATVVTYYQALAERSERRRRTEG
jgi:hypothetical protein